MKVNPIPEGYHTITPYLVVKNVDEIMSFLKKAFGAVGTVCHSDDQGAAHCEMKVGNSMVMIGRAKDESQITKSMLYLYVENTDEWYKKAVSAGAVSILEPMDQFYGDRNAGVEDPNGNQWWLATRIEELTPEELKKRSEACSCC